MLMHGEGSRLLTSAHALAKVKLEPVHPALIACTMATKRGKKVEGQKSSTDKRAGGSGKAKAAPPHKKTQSTSASVQKKRGSTSGPSKGDAKKAAGAQAGGAAANDASADEPVTINRAPVSIPKKYCT
jgi:hypothetical protein